MYRNFWNTFHIPQQELEKEVLEIYHNADFQVHGKNSWKNMTLKPAIGPVKKAFQS